MEIRQFEALVAVAEERHLGRAAARIGISSSSLSERLSRLEQSAGMVLVERSTKRVGLTAAGVGVLDAARAVVSAWSAARGRMAEVREQRAGVIRIAVVHGADECARELAAAVRRRLPRFTVVTTTMSPRDAKQALYYREIEASVIAGRPHPPHCRWNQTERPTRARFVGRPRVRDLVIQWRGSWSGPDAVTLAKLASRWERAAVRAAHPPVDPWLLAREFLRGPLVSGARVGPGPPPSDGPGRDASAPEAGEHRGEDPDELEIDFDLRGCVPAEDATVEDMAVDDAVVGDAVIEDAVIQDATVQDATVQDATVEDVAVDDAVVDDAVIQDASVEEVEESACAAGSGPGA